MILTAIAALKGRKGSSWYAISKYISDNFSDLPPTHANLLSHHLRLLHSKGAIRMLKLCYKLQDVSTNTTTTRPRPRGRPPKSSSSAAPQKRRGRPPKLSPHVASDGPVYIISQAEQLSSALLQTFPGAVAIVVPRSLLTEKAARSPIVISPKGIRSLVDASVGERKRAGRKNVDGERKRGRPRKAREEEGVSTTTTTTIGGYGGDGKGKLGSFVGKGTARPWKIRDLLEKSGEVGMLETGGGIRGSAGLEVKKRSVGRPRKKPLIQGPDSLSDVLVK